MQAVAVGKITPVPWRRGRQREDIPDYSDSSNTCDLEVQGERMRVEGVGK